MQERSSVARLTASLRNEVTRYPAGEKLPSSRALVNSYQVSPGTMSRAIAALVAEGLVVSRPGAGVYRAADRRRVEPVGDVSWQEVALGADSTSAVDAAARSAGAAAVLTTLATPPPGITDLRSGYLNGALQPERALATAMARAGRRPGTWERPPVEGIPELRNWFARDIGSLSASDVLITAGGQTALATALAAVAAPGAPVLVESPTYPGILAVARAAGLRPFPVPVDGDGARADMLAEAFQATRARVFICQPLFQNPTGATLSAQRRADVLRVARAAGAFVLEDDFARHLVHADGPPPLPALAADDPDGVVIHVRSLTKAASPNLRIAGLSARGPVFERLRAIHVVNNFFVPRPLQETALDLVSSAAWARHLRSLATALRDRRTAAHAVLRDSMPDALAPQQPLGGYHLWLRLPDGTDESAIVAAALHSGVAVLAGSPYFAAEPTAPHLRLSYAHATSISQLEEALHRLARAIPHPKPFS